MIRRQRIASMPKPTDPFAKFRLCGCLTCQLILTVLDRQYEAHRTGWKTDEVLHALAELSAFFCNEIYAQHGPAALAAYPRALERHLTNSYWWTRSAPFSM